MEQVEGEIYCEEHGCIHEENDDPYYYGDGNPECSELDWRILWAGRYVAKIVRSES